MTAERDHTCPECGCECYAAVEALEAAQVNARHDRADLAAAIVAAVEGLPTLDADEVHLDRYIDRFAVLDAIREACDDRRA